MKYPRIDRKPLSKDGKKFFDCWHKEIKWSIAFDNRECEMKLTKKDIEILAWNCATHLVASYERRNKCDK